MAPVCKKPEIIVAPLGTITVIKLSFLVQLGDAIPLTKQAALVIVNN